MDSEDDVYSVDDDFYSGDMDDEYHSDGADDDDGADFDFLDEATDDLNEGSAQQNYTVLKDADVRRRQEDDITRVSTVLSISPIAASILLRHYNWNVSKVHDEWFADEEAVRKTVGLPNSPAVELSNCRDVNCGICFESFPRDMIASACCGHPFCKECWSRIQYDAFGHLFVQSSRHC